MPYKTEYEHKVIPRYLDRRVKISLVEHAEIKRLYGKISQRKLAQMFGVSRRLIIFIGCPEKKKKDLVNRALRGGSMQYYDKEEQRKSIQETRKYRRELDNKKLLGKKK